MGTLRLRKYRVLELMEKAGYREQEEFANALGITRQWFNACLNGRVVPSTGQLVKMCQLLGCQSIDEIAEYPKGKPRDIEQVAPAVSEPLYA